MTRCMRQHKHSHRGIEHMTCAGRSGGHSRDTCLCSAWSINIVVIKIRGEDRSIYSRYEFEWNVQIYRQRQPGRRSQVSNTDMDKWHGYHQIWLDHWLTAHGVLTHDIAAAHIPRNRRCRSRRCSGCPHTSGWALGWCLAWRGRFWSCCWNRTESSGPGRTNRQLPPVQTRSRMRSWDY